MGHGVAVSADVHVGGGVAVSSATLVIVGAGMIVGVAVGVGREGAEAVASLAAVGCRSLVSASSVRLETGDGLVSGFTSLTPGTDGLNQKNQPSAPPTSVTTASATSTAHRAGHRPREGCSPVGADRGFPHLRQNCAVSSLGAPQLGQNIGFGSGAASAKPAAQRSEGTQSLFTSGR